MMLQSRSILRRVARACTQGHGTNAVCSRSHSTFDGTKPALIKAGLTASAPANAAARGTDRRNPNLDLSRFIPGLNPDPSIIHPEASSWEDNIRSPASAYRGAREDSWWTGKKPAVCPGLRQRDLDGVLCSTELVSLPALDLRSPSRDAVQAYFDNTWALTEVLFSGLQGEKAFYAPPYHDLRHPMIFYCGHVATLYINKLRVSGVLSQPIDAYFEHIFETGVDEMSWDDLNKNAMLWPAVDEVTDYRREVYKVVSELIATSPALCSGGSKAVRKDDPLWALVMGFEHERIHLETSSVLMREMPLSQLNRPLYWPSDHPGTAAAAEAAEEATPELRQVRHEMVPVQGRDVQLGKPSDFPSFGWDNEYGAKETRVPDFEASRFLTTNADMLEFVRDGGYQAQEHWSANGWGWKEFRNVKHPTFFMPQGPQGLHQYELRTVFGTRPLEICGDWPAIVCHHEAAAFCAWKSQQEGRGGSKAYRIVTEAEHGAFSTTGAQAAAEAAGEVSMEELVRQDAVMQSCGQQFADGEAAGGGANLNLGFSSESPVDAYPANEAGMHDAKGNVWEWTADHFSPLEGFKPEGCYQDFSTPCFDGEHHVIKGGSFIATGDEASRYARFHFRPHFFQHAGFRLVASSGDTEAPVTTGARDSSNVVRFSTAAQGEATQGGAECMETVVGGLREDSAAQQLELLALKQQNAELHAAVQALAARVGAISSA